MQLTIELAMNDLLYILKENAPVRALNPNKKDQRVGKKGTNMESPYPGNLKNNGIYAGYTSADKGTIMLSGVDGKVGYLPYTETRSRKPNWQSKSINQFVSKLCSTYGGRRL